MRLTWTVHPCPCGSAARSRGTAPDRDDLVLAVVVNGRIAAVTRSGETEDEKTEYGAMIPPGAFVDGKNDVELVLIRGVGNDRRVLPRRALGQLGASSSFSTRSSAGFCPWHGI